jgi:hypothetical protein
MQVNNHNCKVFNIIVININYQIKPPSYVTCITTSGAMNKLSLISESVTEIQTLREKHKVEMRSHEERRRADRASPLSCLALQCHPRHAPGRISDYYTFEMRAS